jgi:SAM-dependent methyltransferase
LTDPAQSVRQPCPVCGGSSSTTIRAFDDGVTVARCSGCSAIYTPHRHPNPESLLAAANYERLVWIFGPLASGAKPHFRAGAFKAYLRLVMKHARGGRLLDVGCAHGFFGVEARRLGFEVTGIEPAPPFARYASEVNGLRVVKGVVAQADLGDGRWDAITFTDSLEYVPDPVADLSRLARHLKDDGVLFVKVPNGATSLMRWRLSSLPGLRRLGRSAFTPSLRVMHYSHQSLAGTLNRAGYEVLEQGVAPVVDPDPITWQRVTGLPLESAAPMWFDATGRIARRLGSIAGKLLCLASPTLDSLSLSIYAVARRRRP